VNFARYSAGRCFSTSAGMSASVAIVMTVGMMIGRGNGRDQSARLYNIAAKVRRSRILEVGLARLVSAGR
jgi:hypothetical protein